MSFAHLHVHTEYSLLDGACRIKPMLDKIKSMGQNSVAITDHGNMFGVVNFYKQAKAIGIKPIIGCEVYVAPRSRFDKVNGLDNQRYHLILLCENNTGYKNLIKIVSSSWIDGFYKKPRIDKDLLAKYHEGIICLSGCLFGEVDQLLFNDNYSAAKETALWYKKIFGENNYFLEIQNHFLNKQAEINPLLRQLSSETGIKLAATNDAHYIEKEDSKIQQILICIQTNHILGESTGLDFETNEFYLKSEDEMNLAFSLYPDAVSNTQLIADRCNVELDFSTTYLPDFSVPDGYTHFEFFRSKCLEGFREKYGDNPPEAYVNRLNYELGVIDSMGYTDYYLIVQDFVNYAKNNNIPVGPGRGSGAASICAYCIGITGIDPMKYNLLFERFLNPERVSMPDFDIDFCFEKRQEVINYVIKKYGSDHVSQIITFGTMAAKASVRDIGRVLGISYNKVDSVAKLIPRELDITLEKALQSSKELRQLYDNDDTSRELIDYAMKIEGMPRHASTHAAGVVITAKPVNEYVPLAVNDNAVVTQYTMKEIEQLGLLKMDFLGLRTLTAVKETERLVRLSNPEFDIDKIPIDDKKVYRLFSSADTEGVFQFESNGIKRVLSQLKPECIEDIIAVIALYRPGPMDSIPKYIENKNHPEKITYSVPELKPILDITYGCIVYQEQVMQICRDIAGYSFGRSDIVRRAMAKKQHDVMKKEREAFIYGVSDDNGNVICDGAVKRGVSEESANKLFDEIISFSSYAFNKAHAAAYAYLSYQTAYLKCYYPKEFFSAQMSCFLDRADKITGYIAECSKNRIKILPPDINLSSERFSINNEGIIFCLSAVKNIGFSLIEKINLERMTNGSFRSFFDFCRRMYGRDLNRRALESLIKCGAFDSLNNNRKQLLMSIDETLETLNSENKRNVSGQLGFGDLSLNEESIDNELKLPDVTDFNFEERLKLEKEVTDLYLSGHPMDKYREYYNSGRFDLISDIMTEDSEFRDGSEITVLSMITSVSKKTTRTNSQIVFLGIEDSSGSIEAVLFNKIYEQFKSLVYEGNVVVLNGKLSVDEEKGNSILINVIQPVSEQMKDSERPKKKSVAKGLFLKFDNQDSPQVDICKNLISIFDGNERTMFYFSDSRHYVKLNSGVSVNDVLLRELRKILGKDNVIFND